MVLTVKYAYNGKTRKDKCNLGHTNYWTFKPIPKGQTKQVETKYQRAIKECSKVVYEYNKANGGLSGYSAHCKLGTYGGIKVNGSRDEACEDFTLREHYKQNYYAALEGSKAFFCKTRQYPYDTVVTACLIILKYHLGDLIEVSSDGDCCDWWSGQILADKILGRRHKVPDSIRKSKQCSCKPLGKVLYK